MLRRRRRQYSPPLRGKNSILGEEERSSVFGQGKERNSSVPEKRRGGKEGWIWCGGFFFLGKKLSKGESRGRKQGEIGASVKKGEGPTQRSGISKERKKKKKRKKIYKDDVVDMPKRKRKKRPSLEKEKKRDKGFGRRKGAAKSSARPRRRPSYYNIGLCVRENKGAQAGRRKEKTLRILEKRGGGSTFNTGGACASSPAKKKEGNVGGASKGKKPTHVERTALSRAGKRKDEQRRRQLGWCFKKKRLFRRGERKKRIRLGKRG